MHIWIHSFCVVEVCVMTEHTGIFKSICSSCFVLVSTQWDAEFLGSAWVWVCTLIVAASFSRRGLDALRVTGIHTFTHGCCQEQLQSWPSAASTDTRLWCFLLPQTVFWSHCDFLDSLLNEIRKQQQQLPRSRMLLPFLDSSDLTWTDILNQSRKKTC